MKINDYQKITSSDNGRLRQLEKLNSKKYRQKLSQFMVENLTIIVDALKDGHDFEALFVTEEFSVKNQKDLLYIQDNSSSKNFFLIDGRLNKRYSNLDTPSGITAIYNIKDKKIEKSSVIYLNGVSDPGNLGTIMRSALAFDFVNVVLDETCVDIYNSKVINAAKDAIFKLNIMEDKNGDWLKNTKLPLYATCSHDGTDLSDFTPAKSFCLILGSESHGVSQALQKQAKNKIKIEISSKIESLNVASAAAILFYEFKQKSIDKN